MCNRIKSSFLIVFAVLLSISSVKALSLHPPSTPGILSTSTSRRTSHSSDFSAANTERSKAIVVGAGPVGIATALTLASPPHNYDVKLLETAPQTSYDPTRAFMYLVNRRGQVLTEMFPSMQRKLEERGVSSAGFGAGASFVIVPADPDVPLPEKAMPKAGNYHEEGHKDKAPEDKKKEKPGYWMPRHEMCNLMLECIEEHEQKRIGGDNTLGRIEYLPGTECLSVRPDKNCACLAVGTKDISTGKTSSQQAKLVVGADGINSKVRECLATQDADAFAGWSNFNPKKFVPRKWRSPSSFQRIKVLQLPPRFKIPDGQGGHITSRGKITYALRSIYNSPRKYLSLGLLPMKNDDVVRPTNIVTRPDHEIWKYKDGKSVREWFEKAYPRFPFHEDGGLISDEEWDRFASAEGTRFPACQYTPGMATCDDDGKCGVALVGDAIHAFPPDIGQGVNAGLADVVALGRALKGDDTVTGSSVKKSGNEPEFKANLDRYQAQHSPETAALIRLARFGAPYQYRQPHRIDRLRAKLWTANVLLRLLLNKLTFGLVPMQCILLSQNAALTYRQVMRRADIASRSLKAIVFGVLVMMLKKRLASVLPFLG